MGEVNGEFLSEKGVLWEMGLVCFVMVLDKEKA